jgi:hypothetical protein
VSATLILECQWSSNISITAQVWIPVVQHLVLTALSATLGGCSAQGWDWNSSCGLSHLFSMVPPLQCFVFVSPRLCITSYPLGTIAVLASQFSIAYAPGCSLEPFSCPLDAGYARVAVPEICVTSSAHSSHNKRPYQEIKLLRLYWGLGCSTRSRAVHSREVIQIHPKRATGQLASHVTRAHRLLLWASMLCRAGPTYSSCHE